ncbi:ribonuclease P protein subunit p20 [Orussus abietinus]|uniref:ribonuclease P protein subunit p20 n=1 Tax=Orussus abietinus TaxID=222816 RepID=UPI0006263B91|nr:ribonuclease P protein subunit p20 [Orussus abietinus]
MAETSDRSGEDVKEQFKNKQKRKEYPKTQYLCKKKYSIVQPKRKKDIYVTKKTNFKAQLSKCEKLLDAGESEIIIHGLGTAVNRACHLALQLKENHHGTVDIDVNTSTVELIDEFEPLTDDVDYEVNNRHSSAIHIRVFRKALLGTLKYAM